MRYVKTECFDGDILGVELGWSLVGPPLMTVRCYIWGRTMIDTGQAHLGPEVVALAREHGVERVFLTHHHEDHSGNAAALRRALGVAVHGHRLTAAKLSQPYPILPYQRYVWGATTPVAVTPLSDPSELAEGLVPIHTPGHARDHSVYFLPDRGVLFSGDLYLGDRIRYFRSDEDIDRQIASLRAVAGLDVDTLLCAHNPRPVNGREHLRTKLAFLENFRGEVVALGEKGLSAREIFRRLRLKEATLVKMICCGNVSLLNGVRSVLRHRERDASGPPTG